MSDNSYNKKYYEENKERILNMLKEKIKCPSCDREVNRSHLKKHKASDLCKKYTDIRNNSQVMRLSDGYNMLRAEIAELRTMLKELVEKDDDNNNGSNCSDMENKQMKNKEK